MLWLKYGVGTSVAMKRPHGVRKKDIFGIVEGARQMAKVKKTMKNTNTEHQCKICRKWFSTLYYPDWAYRGKWHGNELWFCGYNCMREWQKAHERKPDLRMEE